MNIYLTSFPNGKIYIGQEQNFKPNYFGSGVKCLDAIKKFGKDSLNKEVLKDNIRNQKMLDLWEMVYIKKYKSHLSNIGYNILIGSSNKFGHGSPMLIKEVALKNSKSQIKRYKKDPNLAIIISKRQKEKFKDKKERQKISEKLKGRFVGELNPNYQNYWSKQQKEHLSDKMKGRFLEENNPNFGNKWSKAKKELMSKKIKEGFKRGRKNPMLGRKRITNGEINSSILIGEPLPKGFWFGMKKQKR